MQTRVCTHTHTHGDKTDCGAIEKVPVIRKKKLHQQRQHSNDQSQCDRTHLYTHAYMQYSAQNDTTSM